MRTFLTPLRNALTGGLALRNDRTGGTLAHELIPAFDSKTRRSGLLGFSSLPPGTGMVIAPTNAIHTFFMRFPIDVAFVARDGRVVKIRESMPAWRIAAAWGGYAVVELAAGALARSGTRPGDRVSLAPVEPAQAEC